MAIESLTTKVSVRIACEKDLNAILALLLTSFRQFSLFDFLYSPLNENLNFATDTVFSWRKRLLLDILDPEASVIIAEVPSDSPIVSEPLENDENAHPEYAQSLEAWKWTEKNHLTTVSTDGKRLVVGFAIWRIRPGEDPKSLAVKIPTRSLYNQLQVLLITFEVWMWKKLHQRKDQEPSRYKAYLEAEDLHSKNFHQETCYYLDNLCVDFRYQRRGIGSRLLQWGLDVANELKLWVGTEGSSKGLGLYLKHGFKQVGWFTVSIEGEEHQMPVLRLDQPQS